MDYSGNILLNKKWVACGDSFTHGDFKGLREEEYLLKEGRYAGENCVYPFIIGNRNDMDIINEAVNGGTIADPRPDYPDEKVFVRKRLYAIPKDADYITLKFGINDWHQNVPIGEMDSFDTSTFCGAWNVTLEYLLENCPFAKIGIIVTNGINDACAPDYTDVERKMGERWGVSVLDLPKDNRLPLLHRTFERDGLCDKAINLRMEKYAVSETNKHPNPKAHIFESTIVENFLRSI